MMAFHCVGVLILTGCLACSKKQDPEADEFDALLRNRAETAARQAKAMGTDPESIAAADKAKAEASAQAEGNSLARESCKRLAQETRDCEAGKPCKRADPFDMQRCQKYLTAEGLDRNPF